MNENKTSYAPADNRLTLWDSIDRIKAELAVRKLQARIVKAQKDGRHNKVKALQWTLTHSFYAKALAVKRELFLMEVVEDADDTSVVDTCQTV